VVQMLGALSQAADRHTPYDAFVPIDPQFRTRRHPLHARTVLRQRQARDADTVRSLLRIGDGVAAP
jgi:hypothetical protein